MLLLFSLFQRRSPQTRSQSSGFLVLHQFYFCAFNPFRSWYWPGQRQCRFASFSSLEHWLKEAKHHFEDWLLDKLVLFAFSIFSGRLHHRNPQRTQEVRDLEPPPEQMTMILTTFQLTASTGAQTRTRLGSWMKMQLLKENRQKRKRKLGERPTLPLLPVLQNRKRSPPAPSSARPTPAMKQIKCAKVKAAPTEAATTS